MLRIREHLSDLGLIALALSPCGVAVVLGVWWLDAQQLALRAQETRLAQDEARRSAQWIRRALDDFATEKADDVLTALRDGGTPILRFQTASTPEVIAAAGLEPSTGAPFPGSDAFPRDVERRLVEQAEATLTAKGVVWSGQAEAARPVTACVPAPPRGAVCLLFESASLRETARAFASASLAGARLVEGGDGEPLPPPLASWAVLPKATSDEPTPRWALAALLAPVASFALLFAWAVRWNWRRRHTETERHVELLAQVAHALRTPLANLRLYAGLIERAASDPTALRRYAAVIGDETGRLDMLLSDALDCARAGAVVSESKRVDPRALAKAIVARIEPRGVASGGAISFEADDMGMATIDARALERCLENLLDNAIRHAPGARVSVSLRRGSGRLTVRVSDDGPGLPPGSEKRLFNSFERGEEAAHGFGLGLAACCALAQAAGGNVCAIPSEAGAVFEVELPVKEAPLCGS